MNTTLVIKDQLYDMLFSHYPIHAQHKLELVALDDNIPSSAIVEVSTPMEYMDLESNEIILNNLDVVKALIKRGNIDEHYDKSKMINQELYYCTLTPD